MSSSRTGEPAIDREPMNLSPHLDREEVARVLDLDGYLRDELRRSAVERLEIVGEGLKNLRR